MWCGCSSAQTQHYWTCYLSLYKAVVAKATCSVFVFIVSFDLYFELCLHQPPAFTRIHRLRSNLLARSHPSSPGRVASAWGSLMKANSLNSCWTSRCSAIMAANVSAHPNVLCARWVVPMDSSWFVEWKCKLSGDEVPEIWRGSNPPSILHPPVASSPPSQ